MRVRKRNMDQDALTNNSRQEIASRSPGRTLPNWYLTPEPPEFMPRPTHYSTYLSTACNCCFRFTGRCRYISLVYKKNATLQLLMVTHPRRFWNKVPKFSYPRPDFIRHITNKGNLTSLSEGNDVSIFIQWVPGSTTSNWKRTFLYDTLHDQDHFRLPLIYVLVSTLCFDFNRLGCLNRSGE